MSLTGLPHLVSILLSMMFFLAAHFHGLGYILDKFGEGFLGEGLTFSNIDRNALQKIKLCNYIKTL